ncbi:hypothetical protein PoB_004448700 [Plakobranchus ocellatus]|uniref:Uncharacterized protein n=1 Tax=Plakobranchus ocellatus TaxID=259542 RepID=A0AAV4BFE8_9GAST|nr:hypothetical protein PoB_004448700 [Plakobranchus ocellatus]
MSYDSAIVWVGNEFRMTDRPVRRKNCNDYKVVQHLPQVLLYLEATSSLEHIEWRQEERQTEGKKRWRTYESKKKHLQGYKCLHMVGTNGADW